MGKNRLREWGVRLPRTRVLAASKAQVWLSPVHLLGCLLFRLLLAPWTLLNSGESKGCGLSQT